MRSRNIKPGFFKNEELGECLPEERLLFIGLWCMADREGRLQDRPRRIKAEIFPYDDYDVEPMLTNLASRLFITRYQIENNRYIQICNFTKHQTPHYKEVPSEIPPPEGHQDSKYIVPALNETEKKAIYERDGRICKKCGSKKNLTIDHVIPRSHGGNNDPNNLQVLCKSCNASKNNRLMSSQHWGDVEPISNQCHASDILIPDSLNLIPDSLKDKPAKSGSYYSPEFLQFWESYPKKSGSKLNAFNNWKKLNGDKPDIETILAAIKAQVEWRENARDGDFRPEWKDPERWIKGRMWEVELATEDFDLQKWAKKRQAEMEAEENDS